jgi:hypothetical protein
MITLFIHTRWRAQSHKWDVNSDGMVEYDGRLLTPREVYENFLIDYPMFDVLRVEVCQRFDDGEGPRPYRWVSLERLDR